jgi:hypothetical protein
VRRTFCSAQFSAAVQAQARFQPQRVARAQADRLDFGLGQQFARQRLGLRRRHRDLEAVLAGVAAAGDEQVRALPVEAAAGHEDQLLDAGHQPLQRVDRLRALQGQQAAVRQGNDLAARRYALLDVGDVTFLAGAIHDHEQVVTAVDEHQVVDDGALVGQQQAVALLADGEVLHVHRHQRFEGRCRVGPGQAQLAHVRDVEQAGRIAGVLVLGHQAGGVLDRHGIAGEGDHARTQFQVQRVQGGLP